MQNEETDVIQICYRVRRAENEEKYVIEIYYRVRRARRMRRST
jgi:hypothetical protein